MAPKILLLGSNGQVGSAILPLLGTIGEVRPLDRHGADFTKPTTLATIVDDLKPQIIVNAAAYTAVDKAESERELAFRINRDSPLALAQAAARAGALFVHFSTDYVFPGNRAGDAPGYREDDPSGPLSAYGESKLAGEIAIASTDCLYMIFRCAWVYAANGSNFVKTMRRLSHERETLRVVADQIGAPTWAQDIATVTAAVIQRHADDIGAIPPENRGIFHLTAGGRTSWHGFAQAIVAAERKRTGSVATRSVEPIATKEYPLPAKRPAFSVLDNSRLRNVHGIGLEDWHIRFQAFLSDEAASR
jgi:dTDP-4-dehydrorhamnose reductase